MDYDTDMVTVRVPTYDTGGVLPFAEWQPKECYADELLEVVDECETIFEEPAFSWLMNRRLQVVEHGEVVNKEICPLAFSDDFAREVIVTESMCEKYSCLPNAPAALDGQDPMLMNCFIYVIETKNRYELLKMEREKEKMRKGAKR